MPKFSNFFSDKNLHAAAIFGAGIMALGIVVATGNALIERHKLAIAPTDLLGAVNCIAQGCQVVYLTSGTSWSVPANYDPTKQTTVHVIGGGGGGRTIGSASIAGGGGGGAYSRSYVTLTPNTTVTYGVGAGGAAGVAGGDSWFNASSFAACTSSTSCAKAKGGSPSTGTDGGNGGSTSLGVGALKYSGGKGGSRWADPDGTATGRAGAGGGGAAGPFGDGAAGGDAGEFDTSSAGGAGGGGGGGGSTAVIGDSRDGSDGGNNYAGSGGGAGSSSGNGGAGTVGGGGGGGDNTSDNGGAGGAGTEWSSVAPLRGSGGGGGGAGGIANTSDLGGAGGLYGGGGAGGGTGGAGASGIIVIVYNETPFEVEPSAAIQASSPTTTNSTYLAVPYGTAVTVGATFEAGYGGTPQHTYEFLTKPLGGIGASFTVPKNWSTTDPLSIEVIGGGGGGNDNREGAGGGGAYSKKNALIAAAGDQFWYRVGYGGTGGGSPTGGGNTWFCDTSFWTFCETLTDQDVVVSAERGNQNNNDNENSISGRGGDAANGIGDVKYSGGDGWQGSHGGSDGGSGGGGAAGPGGAGKAGGRGGDDGAGGGGGAGGGSSTAGESGASDRDRGGLGGHGPLGTGGGAGGDNSPIVAAVAGSNGGGGGGGAQASGVHPGAIGGTGSEWDATHGAGGGGGGGSTNGNGAKGGLYGGGAGSGGESGSGGVGAQGIVAVKHTEYAFDDILATAIAINNDVTGVETDVSCNLATTPLESGLKVEVWDYDSNVNRVYGMTDVDQTVNFNPSDAMLISRVGLQTLAGARWSGYVVPSVSGNYRFYTTSDDGVQLRLNNNLIIDDWEDQSPVENQSALMTLTAGVAYPIRLDYYNNGGSGAITLSWSGPSISKQIIPAIALKHKPTEGLEADYYDGTNFNTFVYSRIDPNVNFADMDIFGSQYVFGANSFSVRWSGYITPPTTGSYTFYTNADDGERLYVNGVLRINQWTDGPPTEYSSSAITLTGGQRYPIVLEFYENSSGSSAVLSWSGPGITKQAIPQNVLTYEEASNTSGCHSLPELSKSFTYPSLANDPDESDTLKAGTYTFRAQMETENSGSLDTYDTVQVVVYCPAGTTGPTCTANLCPQGQEWSGTSCVACGADEHTEWNVSNPGGICMPNTRVCSIPPGSGLNNGTETWNAGTQTWGACTQQPIITTVTANDTTVTGGTTLRVRKGNSVEIEWEGTNLPATCTINTTPAISGGDWTNAPVSSTPTGGNATVGPIMQGTNITLTCGTAVTTTSVGIIPTVQEI